MPHTGSLRAQESGEDVLTGVQMCVQGRDRRGPVTRLDRVDQALVFSQNAQEIARIAARVALHETHESTQLAQDTRNQTQARAFRERDVELFIEFDESIRAARFGGAPLASESRTQVIE